MSFKRLDQEDIVISADSITAPAWSDNQTNLTTFFTSSAKLLEQVEITIITYIKITLHKQAQLIYSFHSHTGK